MLSNQMRQEQNYHCHCFQSDHLFNVVRDHLTGFPMTNFREPINSIYHKNLSHWSYISWYGKQRGWIPDLSVNHIHHIRVFQLFRQSYANYIACSSVCPMLHSYMEAFFFVPLGFCILYIIIAIMLWVRSLFPRIVPSSFYANHTTSAYYDQSC